MHSLKATALGLAVRFLREDLKLTSNDLAAQVGMTPSSLSRSERGLRMLDLDEADRIAKALGVGVEALIERAYHLEREGVVKRHVAALANLSKSLDAGRMAALASRDAVMAKQGR